MKKTKIKQVGVFGHYGNSNYGDEAIIAAVIENTRNLLPHSEIACFSINPEDSKQKHGLPAYPIRRGKMKKNTVTQAKVKTSQKEPASPKQVGRLKSVLKRLPLLWPTLLLVKEALKHIKNSPAELLFLARAYSNLKTFDLLIVSGSNQFLDNFGGAGGFPYTLLKWTVLCKLAGVKIAYAGVGAGPLDGWRSKLYIHLALLMADYLSYRDGGSKALVEKTIFPINGNLSPDLAHSLSHHPVKSAFGNPLTVGINPMPVYDQRYWYAPDAGKYEAYVRKMTTFVSWLLDKGKNVFLFNTMIKDLNVIEDILNRLQPTQRKQVAVKQVDSVKELMSTIDSADITVATRFHGFILSMLAEKPLLGICYYRKSREIMEEMEQGQYAYEIESFRAEELIAGFSALEQELDSVKQTIQQKNAAYHTALQEQYATILDLIR